MSETNAVKPSIKSVEGGSAVTVLLTTIVAGYVILTGDRETITPENAKLIIDAGLDKAATVKEVIDVYKMAETPTDYAKVIEMLAVLIPGSGFLGFFTKKRSDVKIAAMKGE